MNYVHFVSTLCLISVFAAATVSALTPVNLCVVLRTGRVPQAGHALFAASFYANEYTNLQVNAQVVGIWEAGGTTTRGCVRAFAANGTNCDILIGPGSSGIAQAMNPLVNSMWLDYSATATTLSDRVEYALFSRVVPTDSDATAGMGYLMRDLDWTAVYLVCADNAYGQSVVAGVSASVNANGGSVISADCTLPSATYAVVEAKLVEAMASATRVIFAAMATTDVIFPLFIKAVLNKQAYLSHTILFSESACSSTPFAWQVIPGAFCATFAVDHALFDAFYVQYLAADKTAYSAAFQGLGWPLSSIDLTSTSTYPALAADATRFALRAYSSYVAAKGSASSSASTMVAWLRNQTMTGFSGFITFPTGNRAAANMVVYNSAPVGSSNATTVIVAANTTATGNVSLAQVVYCFGQWRSRNQIPRALDPAASSATDSTGLIVGVVLGAAALLCISVAVSVATRGPAGKNNRFAPKEAHKEFTIIFTDIQSSTAQWAKNAEVMGPAVDQHHALIRTAISKNQGYEVKTIGDSFMVAFENAGDALRCSMMIQDVLYNAHWPAGVDELYREKEAEARFVSYGDGTAYGDVWSGLRVRVGMHTGTGDIKFDPVALSYDYYGTVVNTAARVEGVGNGGQVLLTDAAIAAVTRDPSGKEFLSTLIVLPLGPQPLRGLQGPVPLTQLLAPEYEGRRFQALRLDQEPDLVDENSDEDESGTGTTTGTDHASVASQSLRPEMDLVKLPTFPKDTPEYEIRRASRRLARNGITAASLMDLYNFLRASVSTVPAQHRKKVVYDIAEKWRIPEAKKKGTGDHEKDCNFMLVRLAAKAAPVAFSFKNPFNAAAASGRLGEGSRLLDQSRVNPSAATWSEGRASPADQSISPKATSLIVLIPGAVAPIPTQGEEGVPHK